MTPPVPSPRSSPARRRRDPAARRPANPFGLSEAVVGLAASFVLAEIAVSAFGAVTHHLRHPGTFGADVTSLLVLWGCWIGAALYASWLARRRTAPAATATTATTARPIATALRWLRDDYGLELRPWPDLPLGIAVGVASQYVLVPVLEAPLLPFVPHLYTRLGGPANELAAGASGASLALLGFLVCVGSPVVEELFFRGLLLRAVAGRLAGLGPRLQAPLSVLLVAIVFGLVHFEALQLIGLVGFGVVLGTLAWRTGRLGPGIVAHASFNTVTIVALALRR